MKGVNLQEWELSLEYRRLANGENISLGRINGLYSSVNSGIKVKK
jgi:hypothetical protein